MQFRILTRDTIRGFQAFFGTANQAPDDILYSITQGGANNNPNLPPGNVIQATRTYALRGQGVPTIATNPPRPYYYDQYVTYSLETPYVVDPGIYFVTVSQLAQTGIELGANTRNMGQVTTISWPNGPPGIPGSANTSMPAHPEFRTNRFWYETTAESGNWNPMITTVGNPGFPHLNWQGVVSNYPTFSRGSWIPMIRPFFGAKESGACLVEPVELASFEVTPTGTALRLDWSTATEMDNRGFHIERREKGMESSWSDIGFREGAGTSNRTVTYSFTDDNVAPEVTYQYRLRQEDRDGTVNFSAVREGRLAGATTGALSNSLSQNVPNPFGTSTRFDFTVAKSGSVKLEICDMHGNVVRSFDVDATTGANSVEWNGKDQSGIAVPNGVYVYKLVGQGFTLTQKLTVTR
jgi:hypothetical protein